MRTNNITHLYCTGTTNGTDGKIMVLRENGQRQRVWLHHGAGLDMLRAEVKQAVEIAILNPNTNINCSTLEIEV